MRAFVVRGPGDAGVEEVESPVPGPGEVVVDVERVGICGTDVEFFTGEMAYLHQGHAAFHSVWPRMGGTASALSARASIWGGWESGSRRTRCWGAAPASGVFVTVAISVPSGARSGSVAAGLVHWPTIAGPGVGPSRDPRVDDGCCRGPGRARRKCGAGGRSHPGRGTSSRFRTR